MKSIGSVLLSLTLIIFLTSCSSIKKIETFFTPVEREPLGLEEPVLGKLESIKWIVITSENAEEVFKKLEEEGIDPVLFGLTDNDYQLIAKNFAQIRHYIQKQKLQLETYKNYYEPGIKGKSKSSPSTK